MYERFKQTLDVMAVSVKQNRYPTFHKFYNDVSDFEKRIEFAHKHGLLSDNELGDLDYRINQLSEFWFFSTNDVG